MGQDYKTDGTIGGDARRGWLAVKTAVTNANQDDAAVLGVVKSGEGDALKAYEDALAKGLPQSLDKIVKKQKNEIQDAYNRANKQLEKIQAGEKV